MGLVTPTIVLVDISCQTRPYFNSRDSHWIVIDDYLSTLEACMIPPGTMRTSQRDEVSISLILISPCPMTQICNIFSNTIWLIKFWRVTKNRVNSLYCWGIYGTPLVRNSKERNSFLRLGFYLLVALLSIYRVSLFLTHFISVSRYILESFCCSRFPCDFFERSSVLCIPSLLPLLTSSLLSSTFSPSCSTTPFCPLCQVTSMVTSSERLAQLTL